MLTKHVSWSRSQSRELESKGVVCFPLSDSDSESESNRFKGCSGSRESELVVVVIC